MDTLLIYCLLKESPPIEDDEAEIIKINHENIINNGRDIDQNIILNGEKGTAVNFAEEILLDLKKLSLVAGEAVFENGKNNWLEAINLQIKKLENVEESLSGKVLNDLIHNNKSHEATVYFKRALLITKKLNDVIGEAKLYNNFIPFFKLFSG